MIIQELDWITHTHTDYYDVCKIYDGEMPIFLWGAGFWDNHYYLINSDHGKKKEKYNCLEISFIMIKISAIQ